MAHRIKPIPLNIAEARAVLDVLSSVTAYTRQELSDQFGWGQREVDAWADGLRKIDAAITATQ